MKGTGAYIYGRPCWREYGGRTTRSICVGKGVKPKFYFNIGKRPGNIQGGALSDNHPARQAGLEEDIIMGRPLDEMNDEDAIMDPSGRAVYHRDDLLRHIEAQHEQRQIAHMEDRPLPPLTWPTRVPMTEQHLRDIANRRPTRQPRRSAIPLQDLTEEELEDLAQLYEWMEEAGMGG